MDKLELVKVVASILGGGLVGYFLSYRVSMRKQDLPEFEVIVKEYKKMFEDVKSRVKDLEIKQIGLVEENQYLKTSLMLFESSTSDIPLPMWLKDNKGVVLHVNKHYEHQFLTPLGKNISDYIGHTDHDIWPKHIADAFVKHDRDILNTKKSVRSVEAIIDQFGDTAYVDVLKYPRFANNEVIGVAGIVLKTSYKKDDLK